MDSSKKSNKIREIVRLQQLLKKWRKQASSSKPNNNDSNNNIINNNNNNGSKSLKFLKRTLSFSERPGGDTSSNGVPPKGFLAVSVGEEQKRFIIPTEYLGHQAFHMLLREAEEEFGFQQEGVLRIPCDVPMFESIVKMVEDRVEDAAGCYSSDSPLSHSHHPQSPMCR